MCIRVVERARVGVPHAAIFPDVAEIQFSINLYTPVPAPRSLDNRAYVLGQFRRAPLPPRLYTRSAFFFPHGRSRVNVGSVVNFILLRGIDRWERARA